MEMQRQRRTSLTRNGYLQNVTTIVIFHRPYPMKWADRVVFMDGGQITEESPDYKDSHKQTVK